MEKLNKGKIKLEEILKSGKSFGDHTILGYVDLTVPNTSQ